jgi:hypothetical protein
MDPLKTRLQALKADLKALQARAEELAVNLEETKTFQFAGNRLRCVVQDRLGPAVRDLGSIRLSKPKGASR